MIVPFLLGYVAIILFLVIRTKYAVLFNEMFWLIASWSLLFVMHYSSGIKWQNSVSVGTLFFVMLCFTTFGICRCIPLTVSIRRKIKKHKSIEHSVKNFFFVGAIGAGGYIWDYIRLNGIHTEKTDYFITTIGTIGSLFVPLLIVIGLYYFADDYLYRKRISLKGVGCLLLYTIPVIINGGRETILYLGIALAVILSYAKHLTKEKKHKRITIKYFISRVVIVILISVMIFVFVSISSYRFSTSLASYYMSIIDVPRSLENEAKLFGPLESLYYNFVFYFTHQLTSLEIVLKNYNGPYLCGMYELNIISRRLPESLGLDYRLVPARMGEILSGVKEGILLRTGWRTVLGTFIFDFSKWLTPVVCAILGLIVGNANRNFKREPNLANLVLKALICFSMFTTIQIGPFFSFNVYGTFIWWYILFGSENGNHLHQQVEWTILNQND